MTEAEQDLALIRRVMEESRREVVDRGKHFLIWGVIPFFGLLLTYFAATGAIAIDPAPVWLGLLGVGWIASFAVGWMDGRRARVTTLGRKLLTAVWVSVAATMTLVALAGMFGEVVPNEALPGLLSLLIAPPVFLTGTLTRDRWLVWVAGGWWLGGTLMILVPGIYTLLLMAAMALLLTALPGLVLFARSRRGRREGAPVPAPESG